MGTRFRKTKNFGPLRINISKSGVGYSVGNKYVRVTHTADGKKRTTYTIPGTGISWVETEKEKLQQQQPEEERDARSPVSTLTAWLIFIAIAVYIFWLAYFRK